MRRSKMLFEINSNDSSLEKLGFEFFNLPMDMSSRPGNIVDPATALALGNSYSDEYDKYKNYTQRRLVASNEREKMLLRIQELDFIMNDLSLKLDVDPSNYELYELFRKYALELKDLCEKYSKQYEVLELIKDTNGSFTWIKNPWPWDGGKVRV